MNKAMWHGRACCQWVEAVFCLLFCLLVVEGARAEQKKSIHLEDATGQVVEVALPVERLVVLTSDALEIVRALQAEELVVGVYSDISRDSLFWPELSKRPKVGSWKELNDELLVELHPDVVLSYEQRPGKDMDRKLEPFGIKVVRLDFFKLDTLSAEVAILGRLLQREERAQLLIAWYQNYWDFLARRLKAVGERPRVYIEGDSRYHTTGPGSGGHDMCVMAGGYNIASGLSIPYPEVTPEWILTNDPNVIIKVTTISTCRTCYGMTDDAPLKNVRDQIMARPAWDTIEAVKEKKIYVMANEIWTGPRAIVGTSYMAKWFYPELFEDFDPERLHREYMQAFQGMEYAGIYVFP